MKRRPTVTHPAPLQLDAAYAVCRAISRATAKNFYYGFLALPQEKRDAICAVYAFMRHADDIADDPQLPAADKRERLAAWLERLGRVVGGEPTDDPVLMALADAQRRYKIPHVLLEKLVAGTAMDLDQPTPAPPAVAGGEAPAEPAALAPQYATFDGLYQYCYHVASVVGLVCICIFGYRDPAAEPLAERCGVAFQLTNIIRDVKEDAAMGRIYFPREDLDRFGVSSADLLRGAPMERLLPLLKFEADRAREFYVSAEKLLPLIDDDSQAALWTLVTIYRRLLEKIAARNYEVFSGRVRLTTWEKFRVLGRGLWMRLT
jgi:phytoene synthase